MAREKAEILFFIFGWIPFAFGKKNRAGRQAGGTSPLESADESIFYGMLSIHTLHGDCETLQQTFVEIIWIVPLAAEYGLGRREPDRGCKIVSGQVAL